MDFENLEGALDEELDEELDDEYTPEPEPWTEEEPVDQDTHVAVIHDSFGERYVNVALLRERAPVVTVLRAMSAMNLEPRGDVQYFVNGGQVDSDHQLNAGDELYVVGKVAGGK
jgi:molybdopterin converting factor small subunit